MELALLFLESEIYIFDKKNIYIFQKFIELLRKGTADDRGFAIDYIRTSLAPCALNAYPVILASSFFKKKN